MLLDEFLQCSPELRFFLHIVGDEGEGFGAEKLAAFVGNRGVERSGL